MNEPERKTASVCSAQGGSGRGPCLLSQPRHGCRDGSSFYRGAWVTLSPSGPGCHRDRGAVKHKDWRPRAAREGRAPRLPPKPRRRCGLRAASTSERREGPGGGGGGLCGWTHSFRW